MAMVGTGTTISFSTGFFAEILSVGGPNSTRVSIPFSHMGTSADHTFSAGDLVDSGELTVDIAFDPSVKPPLAGIAETVTITFPDSGAATWAFTGFMTAFSPTTPLEDRATATCTIKASGAITVTP